MITTNRSIPWESALLALAFVLVGATSVHAGSVPGSVGTPPDRSLTETYWKLIELGPRKAEVFPNQREPNLIFRSGTNAVSGSGGCNGLAGAYTIDGSALSFGALATTRMMCVAGMEQEAAFLASLERVKEWRIRGDQLELLDAAGVVAARFAAVDLK